MNEPLSAADSELTRKLIGADDYIIIHENKCFKMRHRINGLSYGENLVKDKCHIAASIIVGKYKRTHDINHALLYQYLAAKGKEIGQDFVTQKGSAWVAANCEKKFKLDDKQ